MNRTEKFKKTWYLIFPALVIGIYFGIVNLMQILAYKVLPEIVNFDMTNPNNIMLYMYGTEIAMSFILLAIVAIAYRKIGFTKTCDIEAITPSGILKSVICGLAIVGIVSVLSMVLSSPYGGGGPSDTLSIAVTYITSVIFAPIIEELLFRGIVFSSIDRFKGGWFSVLTSSMIFAAYHMDLIQGIFTFIMGIFLALAYQKTRNIKYPILIHGVNNLMVCINGTLVPAEMREIVNWISFAMIIPLIFVAVRCNKDKRKLQA